MVVMIAVAIFRMHDDFAVLAVMRMFGLGMNPTAGERSQQACNPNWAN